MVSIKGILIEEDPKSLLKIEINNGAITLILSKSTIEIIIMMKTIIKIYL